MVFGLRDCAATPPLPGAKVRRCRRMKRQKYLVFAVLCMLLSVVAPLLAGYCLNCNAVFCPSGCMPGQYVGRYYACATCKGLVRHFCTTCDWDRWVCVSQPPYYPPCHPPYAWAPVLEQNDWGLVFCSCLWGRPNPPYLGYTCRCG